MATIKICDWSKQPIPRGEQPVILTINDQEFEISQNSAAELTARLEADDVPDIPSTPVRAAALAPEPASEPMPAPTPEAPPRPNPESRREPPAGLGQMLDVEIEGDPFEADEKPRTTEPQEDITPEPDDPIVLNIPDDPSKPLPPASKETWQRIMKQATKFEAGTLPALDPGSSRTLANKRLAEINEQENARLKRLAGRDVNINEDKR